MQLIAIAKENLEREHICCAISNNNDCQVASKKAWLAQRLDDGLVFLKGDVRGKCFIEYIPAEKAWAPVDAEGFMYIDRLWVAGQFKGQGCSNLLLDECIRDSKAKGKKGLVTLSSDKKRALLSDAKFLKHKGFIKADEAPPFFELWYLPFADDADKPRFKDCVKTRDGSQKGFVLYYCNQCPFTAKYVPIIEALAAERGVPFKSVRFETTVQAQASRSPFTAYSLFYNGEFVTNEILSAAKFAKLLDEKGF